MHRSNNNNNNDNLLTSFWLCRYQNDKKIEINTQNFSYVEKFVSLAKKTFCHLRALELFVPGPAPVILLFVPKYLFVCIGAKPGTFFVSTGRGVRGRYIFKVCTGQQLQGYIFSLYPDSSQHGILDLASSWWNMSLLIILRHEMNKF